MEFQHRQLAANYFSTIAFSRVPPNIPIHRNSGKLRLPAPGDLQR
jgi:hypothetical protein